MHFKSSINRSPRTATPGTTGEQRLLKLELQAARRRRPARLSRMPASRPSSAPSRPRRRRSRTIRSPRCIRTWAWSASSIGRSFVIADIPGPDRRRRRWRGPGHPVPAPRAAHAPAAAPGRHRADGRQRRRAPAEQVRAIENELRKYDPAMLREAALAGVEQGRPAVRRKNATPSRRRSLPSWAGPSRGSWSRRSPARTPWRSASRCSVSSSPRAKPAPSGWICCPTTSACATPTRKAEPARSGCLMTQSMGKRATAAIATATLAGTANLGNWGRWRRAEYDVPSQVPSRHFAVMDRDGQQYSLAWASRTRRLWEQSPGSMDPPWLYRLPC